MPEKIIKHVIIRRMLEQDLDSVYKIEQHTASSDPWDKEIFSGCSKVYDAFVATIYNNLIIGFGIIAIYSNINEAHIINLAVDKHHQAMGIGSLLLQHLIDTVLKKNNKLNNIGSKIFLEVNINNNIAINLYKKFNFHKIGVRKKYYNTEHGQQDALVLMLDAD